MADYFWSRAPGKFVDKTNGRACTGATFTGTVREWYETLIEVMNDVQRVALEENGNGPIPRVKWVGDPDACMLAAASVLVKSDERDEDYGVLGAPMRLVLRYGGRIPIESSRSLSGTGLMKLIHERAPAHQRTDQIDFSDVVLGTVKVLDLSKK